MEESVIIKKNNFLSFNNIVFAILITFVLLYFYNLGLPSIWNPNEAFYAEAPREMLEKKDFTTPYFNYEYRFQKPILTYWLVLLWYHLLGVEEISVRMVSAISAAFGVFLVWWLGKTIWSNNRAGLISGVLLAASLDYNSLARYGSTDMLLTMLITLSLVLFYKGYVDNNGRQRLWYFMVYIVGGFAVLTKGPIGIVMPLLVIAAFFLIMKDFHGLKNFISFYGFLTCLLIGLSWYIYMIYLHGNDFFSVLYNENIMRFTKKISGSSDPFYYVPVILWDFFPGSIFIIPAFYWIFKNIREQKNEKFPLVWFLTVFIFFSLSKSKLPAYILPALPALSIIVGGWINEAFLKGTKKRVLAWLSPVILLVILLAGFWIKTFLPDINQFSITIVAILFFLSLLNIKIKINYLSFVVSMLGMVMFNFVFLSDILPQVERYRPYREIARHVRLVDPDKKLSFFCYEKCQQNLSFYLERKIFQVQDKELPEGRKDSFLLLRKKTFEETYRDSGRKVIWKGHFYDKSESVFMRFLMDIKKNNVEEYVIVY